MLVSVGAGSPHGDEMAAPALMPRPPTQISTPKEVSKERETVSEEFQAEPRPAVCPVLDLGVESAFSKLYKL